MPEPLLRTKLFVPSLRSNLVNRLRLIERLNQGLHIGHRLTLISAPAGFGKTTLAAAFIHISQTTSGRVQTLNSNFACLSLDEHDNDLERFITYLIAALQTVEPDVGELRGTGFDVVAIMIGKVSKLLIVDLYSYNRCAGKGMFND